MNTEQYSPKRQNYDDAKEMCKPPRNTASNSILERLSAAIDRLDINASEINRKLYLLLPYEEPCDSECQTGLSKEPTSFLEKLGSYINAINSIDNRLESSNRHLNEII